MTRRRALLLAPLLVATAVGLAGCSGAPAVATSGPASPSPAPTLAPGVSPFPDHDMSIADAPPALAAAWRPYGVTMIPSANVVAAVGPVLQTIAVSNGSNGAFTDTEVQQLAAAYMRDQLLIGWAAEHVQPSLGAYLAGELSLVGPDSLALSMGTSVQYGACSLDPTSITVLAPTATFDAELTARHEDIQPGSFPLRLTYTGCAVTGTTRSGQTVTVDPDTGPASLLADVILRHDRVLGDILFVEGATVCPDPSQPALCGP